MSMRTKMVKIRIRKDNPSGKAKARFQLISGEWISISTDEWTEVDKSDLEHSSPNSNFFEVEGEKSEEKPKKSKK